jgi:hypothetical protein
MAFVDDVYDVPPKVTKNRSKPTMNVPAPSRKLPVKNAATRRKRPADPARIASKPLKKSPKPVFSKSLLRPVFSVFLMAIPLRYSNLILLSTLDNIKRLEYAEFSSE